MTTLTLAARAISKNAKAVRLPKMPWKLMAAGGGVLFLAALVSYVLLVNQLTQGTYLMKSGTKQLDALVQQNAVLQAQLAQSGLLAVVQEKALALDFQKTAKVTYIQLVGNSVARGDFR